MTGTGKTEVLTQLSNGLDLEGHAHHRGSSFGKRATGQPSNIDFENRVAVDVLKKRARGIEQFVLEDESRAIGSCALPLPLYQGMQQFPMVWLEDSLEGRVERILRDYVVDLCAEFIEVHGDEGFVLFSERLLASLNNVQKRLGGERHQRMLTLMEDALAEQASSGAVDLHRGWIEGLLREYYDPMYAFQREKKRARGSSLSGSGGLSLSICGSVANSCFDAVFFAGLIAGKPAPTVICGETQICDRHYPLWERACPRWGRDRHYKTRSHHDHRLRRTALLTVIQPLLVAVALQAGLAVVPGQREHVQRVVVVRFPVIGNVLFFCRRLPRRLC